MSHDPRNNSHNNNNKNDMSNADKFSNPGDLFDAVLHKQWDVAIERVLKHPEEASQWKMINLRGCPVRLLPLHLAVQLRPPARLIRALLQVDVDSAMRPDFHNRLPIHWSVDSGASDPEVVNVLLEAWPGSAKRIESQFGFTPLHIHCYQSNVTRDGPSEKDQLSIASMLIKANPEALSTPDKGGWLPIHLYARTGRNPKMLHLLFRAYPRGISQCDPKGRQPLHLAMMNGEGREDTALPIIRLLIDLYPAALMIKEKRHAFLPLHVACSIPQPDSTIALLLERYPDAIKQVDARSSLPLHLAIRTKAPSCTIKRILQAHASGAMSLDADGRIPLHFACKTAHSKATIKMLIEVYPGGVFVKENKYGYTSLATACTSVIDDVSIFHLLLSRSSAVASVADQNGALPLHLACQNQLLPSVVRSIVQAYPRAIEVRDRQGNTPKDITMLLANGQRRDDILQVLRLASSPPEINLIMEHVSSLDLSGDKRPSLLRNIDGNRATSAESKQSQPQDGEGKCVICIDKKASFALIPCGHLSLCIQCKQTRLQDLHHTCPVCRSTFHDAMRVFGVPST